MILSNFLCLHQMLYPIDTLQKSNRTRNEKGKSQVVLSVFPLSMNKKKIYFFSANTKYILSRAVNSQVHNFQKLKNISLKAVNFLSNKTKSNLFE